jgi:predicted DNA-binding transcriptional regulator AlpA
MFTNEVTWTGQPLLITAETLATFLAREIRDVWRDNQAGRIPRPVTLGDATYWRLKEIRQWVRAGCPTRLEWETRRNRG